MFMTKDFRLANLIRKNADYDLIKEAATRERKANPSRNCNFEVWVLFKENGEVENQEGWNKKWKELSNDEFTGAGYFTNDKKYGEGMPAYEWNSWGIKINKDAPSFHPEITIGEDEKKLTNAFQKIKEMRLLDFSNNYQHIDFETGKLIIDYIWKTKRLTLVKWESDGEIDESWELELGKIDCNIYAHEYGKEVQGEMNFMLNVNNLKVSAIFTTKEEYRVYGSYDENIEEILKFCTDEDELDKEMTIGKVLDETNFEKINIDSLATGTGDYVTSINPSQKELVKENFNTIINLYKKVSELTYPELLETKK